MAEINIKKKTTPVWAWILGIIIVLAGAFLIYSLVTDNNADQPAGTETVQREASETPTTY